MTYDVKASHLERQSRAALALVSAISIDDDDLNHDMVEGETTLFEAVQSALDEIDECEVSIDGCAAKVEQFKSRMERSKRRIEVLRGLVEQALLVAGMKRMKLACSTITVADVKPKPIISDESLIPSAYWKPSDPKLDRAKISNDVKNGADIPGIVMDNGGTSLKIRRT